MLRYSPNVSYNHNRRYLKCTNTVWQSILRIICLRHMIFQCNNNYNICLFYFADCDTSEDNYVVAGCPDYTVSSNLLVMTQKAAWENYDKWKRFDSQRYFRTANWIIAVWFMLSIDLAPIWIRLVTQTWTCWVPHWTIVMRFLSPWTRR